MKPVSIADPARPGDPARPLLRRLVERLEAIERKLPRSLGTPPPAPFTEEHSLLARLDSRAADATGFERQRVIHRALDEEYFRRELKAGGVAYEGAVTEAKNGDAYVMRFPAGASTAAATQVEARALWPKTRPRLHVWYTSPVGSTATFTIRWVMRFFPVGAVTTGLMFVVDITPAGPAVAGTEMYVTAVGTAVMPALPGPVQIRVGRLTGDANANDLDVVLAVVVFEEVA